MVEHLLPGISTRSLPNRHGHQGQRHLVDFGPSPNRFRSAFLADDHVAFGR